VAKKRIDPKLERLIKQNQAEQIKFKVSKNMFAANRFGPLIFLLAFGILGSVFVFNSFAASDSQTTQPKGRIWLLSDRTTATLGNAVTVQVWADSAGQSVNAVQAHVEYPDDMLEYVQSDTPDDRKVETRVVNTGKRIVIARVGNAETAGKPITSLTFRPKAKGDITLRIVSDESEIRRSSDNEDILGKSDGVQFTVTE
jgi:hypothetical protein